MKTIGWLTILAVLALASVGEAQTKWQIDSFSAGKGSTVADVPASQPLTADTVAAAITAAPSGGVVQLGCATYSITFTLVINKPIRLTGCVRGGTIFNVSPGVTAISYAASGPLVVEYISFLGGGVGITMGSGSIDSEVNHCYFGDVTTAAMEFTGSASRWTVYRNTIENSVTAAYGIHIVSSTDNVEGSIHGNLLSFGGGGVSMIESDGAGDLRIINNKFLGGTTQLIHLINGGTATSEIVIVGNVLGQQSGGSHGIVIDPTSSLGGIVITGNNINSVASVASLIKINSAVIGDITISGNVFGAPESVAAIDLVQTNQTNINGNTFVHNGGVGVGILVGGAVTNTLIGANRFDGYSTNISGTGGSGTQIGVTSATCSNGIVISGTGC